MGFFALCEKAGARKMQTIRGFTVSYECITAFFVDVHVRANYRKIDFAFYCFGLHNIRTI